MQWKQQDSYGGSVVQQKPPPKTTEVFNDLFKQIHEYFDKFRLNHIPSESIHFPRTYYYFKHIFIPYILPVVQI